MLTYHERPQKCVVVATRAQRWAIRVCRVEQHGDPELHALPRLGFLRFPTQLTSFAHGLPLLSKFRSAVL